MRHCRKIVTVELDFFPERALHDGSVIERLMRDYLGTVGLRQIFGLRRSDLFILTDADELPSRDVVEFLRWHDGYTQPVTFSYR
jgi:beta-1,4-mannosyl-glycoprotein beta-1,4-N-acetylglucosaminyltransferase